MLLRASDLFLKTACVDYYCVQAENCTDYRQQGNKTVKLLSTYRPRLEE